MTTLQWYHKRYRAPMAMNLRLPEELAQALRALAEETGRSQQDLAREALEEYVRDYRLRAYPKEVRPWITPARTPGAPPHPDVVRRLQEIGLDTLLANLAAVREDRL